MNVIVKLFGLLLIVDGVLITVKPKELMGWGLKMLNHPRFRWFGTLNLLLGFLLCAAAPYTQRNLLILLFGCAMMLKAGYIYFAPLERMSNNWVFKLEVSRLRAIGVVTVVLGLFVLGA